MRLSSLSVPLPRQLRVEMMQVLMEKAFAKFAGSYQALNGGFSFLAWMAMTGETDVIGWWRQRHQPKWESWISPE